MPGMRKKLDHFTTAVLAEATAENTALRRQIEEKRKAALDAAREDALNEAYQYVHSETARIKAEQGRTVSRRMLEHKRALALRREEIAQQVFAQAEARLAEYTAGPEYAKRLAVLFDQALERLEGAGELILCLRPQDMGHADALKQRAHGRPVEVRPIPFPLGGLILECPENNLRADQTFDNRYHELRGRFAELFDLSLTGESPAKE